MRGTAIEARTLWGATRILEYIALVNEPFDLSAFSNLVVFTVEGVGDVVVEARKTGFHVWLGKGMERSRWPNGRDLMRDLLAEQGRRPDGAALDGPAVAALTDEALEAAAGAFLDARDPVMGPLSAEAGEAADLQPEERQTDRLKRILFANAEAALAPARRLRQEMERRTAGTLRLGETYKALGPVQEMMERHRKLEAMLRPASTLLAAEKALYGGTASAMLRAADQAARLPTFRSPFADLLGPGAAIAEMQASVRRATEVLGIGQVYPHLAKAGFQPKLFGEATSVARLLRTQFDLRLPGAALASIGALHAAEADLASRVLEAVQRPGFQATVVAGLDGVAARGAAADVLAYYGEDPDPDAPIFEAVMSGVTALDEADEVTRRDRLDAALARLAELVSEVLRRENRPITVTGVMTVVGTLMSVISVGIAWMAFQGDEADRRGPDTAAVIAKLDELKMAQPPVWDQRDMRFVHDKAWLRIAPDAKAPAIRAIYPDQPLRVLETEDGWAKVEAYDYASDRPLVGWISRRRLRIEPLD